MAFASIDFFFRVKSYTGALVSCYGKFILLFDLVSSQPCFCFSTRRPSPYWTTDGIAKKVNNKPRSLNNNSNRANFSNGPAIIITRASPKMVKQKKNSNVFWLYSTFPKTIGRVGVRSQMVLRPCVILSGQGGSNDPIVRAEPPVIVGCLYARLDQPSETDSSSSFSSSSFYSSTCLSFFFSHELVCLCWPIFFCYLVRPNDLDVTAGLRFGMKVMQLFWNFSKEKKITPAISWLHLIGFAFFLVLPLSNLLRYYYLTKV